MRLACWPSALSKQSSQRTWRTVVSSLTCTASWPVLSSLISTWQVSLKLTLFIKKSIYWRFLWKWLSISQETHYYKQTVSLLDWKDITMSCKITASLLLLFTRPSLPPLVFCFLLTSGVSVPPRASVVGGQSIHSRHVSWAHPAVPPGHRQRPPRQPATICPHLRSQGHLGVSKLWFYMHC